MEIDEKIVTEEGELKMEVKLTERQKVRILNGKRMYRIMKEVLVREEEIDKGVERVWVACLDPTNKLLNIELISIGSDDRTTLEPRQVFRIPLQKKGTKVILIHNHPFGDLEPSERDLDTTDHLIQAGRVIDIQLADHLIITEDAFKSFYEDGIMWNLRLSLKYVPPYEAEDYIKSEIKKVKKEKEERAREDGLAEGMKKGIKKGKKATAKKLKEMGLSIDQIAQATGLSKKEIESM